MSFKTLPFAALLSLFALNGCVRLGSEFQPYELPSGAPDVASILADLAKNDEAVQTFWATGSFTLKSPKLDAVYRLGESKIVYERPENLFVLGRKYGRAGLRLTSAGPAFLIEFPTEKQYYYRPRGEQIEGVSFAVSPVDIAREAFLPEVWSKLSPRQVELIRYDPATRSAQLGIYSAGVVSRARRFVTVTGAPWIVVQSILFDREGNQVAITTKRDYHELNGVRFPAQVNLEFPGQQAFMNFSMRRIELNQPSADASFDLKARAAALQAEGQREMQQEDFQELAW